MTGLDMDDTTPVCSMCNRTAAIADASNLMSCDRCKHTTYCSQECLQADWEQHKEICRHPDTPETPKTPETGTGETIVNNSGSTAHLKGISKCILKPFTCLDDGTYLHDRPESDVYKLLIDCFRLRQDDNHLFAENMTPLSKDTNTSSSNDAFREFLALATSHRDLLPAWWSEAKQHECEAFAMSDNWSNLEIKAGQNDIAAHYGDQDVPIQLRILGETVYGTGPGGQGSLGMKALMMPVKKN